MWVALRTHPPGPEWIANLISRRIFVNHHCSIIFGLFNFELFRIFSSFILWQILPHLADYFADFPQLQVRVLALDDVPDFSWVPHVWHQRLFRGLGGLGCPVRRLQHLSVTFNRFGAWANTGGLPHPQKGVNYWLISSNCGQSGAVSYLKYFRYWCEFTLTYDVILGAPFWQTAFFQGLNCATKIKLVMMCWFANLSQ